MGWPDAFLPFLAGHLAGEARTALIPLSVSADRLAHPAMRCAVIQAKIAQEHGPHARDGSGRLAEVYPAASLKSWGLLALGYKGRGGVETQQLAVLLAGLKQAAPWLDPAGHEDQLAGYNDMFDAVIAALAARAVALGSTIRPDAGNTGAARTEGWIRLPTGGLTALTGARP